MCVNVIVCVFMCVCVVVAMQERCCSGTCVVYVCVCGVVCGMCGVWCMYVYVACVGSVFREGCRICTGET
jgi:hypothetical protein